MVIIPWKVVPAEDIPPFPKPPILRNFDEDGNATEDLYAYQEGDDIMLCIVTTKTVAPTGLDVRYVTSLKNIFIDGLAVLNEDCKNEQEKLASLEDA